VKVGGLSTPPRAVVETRAVRELMNLVSEATTDSPVRLIVQGEQGLGKHRSIEHALAKHPKAEELLVLHGTPDRFRAPYFPIEDLLRDLIDGHSRKAAFRQLFVDLSADLLQLVPFLGPVAGRIRDLYKIYDPDRLRNISSSSDMLFRLQNILMRVSNEAPTVVVFHEINLFDQSTLAALMYLARRDEPRCSYIFTLDPLGTPRDPQEAENILQMSRDLVHFQRFVRVRLMPFTTEETQWLIDVCIKPHALSTAQIRGLQEKCGGNPLFTWEYLNHLHAENFLRIVDGTWRLTGEYDRATLPQNIREVIEIRMKRLEPQLRKIIDIAAVIGSEFRYEPIAARLELDDIVTLESLRIIEQEHQLVSEARQTNVHRFTFEAIRDAVYEALGKILAAKHHEKLAEYYTAHPFGSDNDYLLYHHTLSAGHHQLAFEHLLKAAQSARSRLAHDEAARRFREARQLLHSIRPYSAIDETRLIVEEAQSLFDSGRFDDVISMVAAPLQLPADAEWRQALYILGMSQYLRRSPAAAIETFSRIGEEHLTLDVTFGAKVRLAKSATLFALGRWDDGRKEYMQAINLLAEPNLKVARCDAIKRINMFYIPELALPKLRQSLVTLALEDDLPLYWEITHNIGCNCLMMGDIDTAESHFLSALEYFRNVRSYRVAYPLSNLAIVQMARRNYTAAEEYCKAARQQPVGFFDQISVEIHLAIINMLRGAASPSIEELQRLRSVVVEAGEVILIEKVANNLAWAFLRAGYPEDARDVLKTKPLLAPDPWTDLELGRQERLFLDIEDDPARPRANERWYLDFLNSSGRSDAWKYREIDYDFSDVWFWE
jgi:tetratricopeptide (TPR) repeat protein